jgi:hypothetical protein
MARTSHEVDALIEAADLDAEPAVRTLWATHVRRDEARSNLLAGVIVRPIDAAALVCARLNKSSLYKSVDVELETALKASALAWSRQIALRKLAHISNRFALITRPMGLGWPHHKAQRPNGEALGIVVPNAIQLLADEVIE